MHLLSLHLPTPFQSLSTSPRHAALAGKPHRLTERFQMPGLVHGDPTASDRGLILEGEAS